MNEYDSPFWVRKLFVVLIKYYLAYHHPNPQFLAALEFLGDKTPCSPMTLQYKQVEIDVVDILHGKKPYMCAQP